MELITKHEDGPVGLLLTRDEAHQLFTLANYLNGEHLKEMYDYDPEDRSHWDKTFIDNTDKLMWTVYHAMLDGGIGGK